MIAPPHELLASFVEQAEDLAEGKEQKSLVHDLSQEAAELIIFVGAAVRWNEVLVTYLKDRVASENPRSDKSIELVSFARGRRSAFRAVLSFLGENQ